MLLPVGKAEVEVGDGAAHQPARRVAHGHGEDGVGDELGHNEEVDLPEDDEAEEHDEHGRAAVAGPAQGPGQDLVHAAEHVEGRDAPQEQGAEADHLGRVVEEADQVRREGDDRHHEAQGDEHGDAQGRRWRRR